jgi:hypothetical protein
MVDASQTTMKKNRGKIINLPYLHDTVSSPGHLHVEPSGTAGAKTFLIDSGANVNVAGCKSYRTTVVGLTQQGTSVRVVGGASLQPHQFCSGEATTNFPGSVDHQDPSFLRLGAAAAGLLAPASPPSSDPWGGGPRGDPPWRCFDVETPESAALSVRATLPLRAAARTMQSLIDGAGVLDPPPPRGAWLTSPAHRTLLGVLGSRAPQCCA